MMRGEREIREWLVEHGHMAAQERDKTSLNICHAGPEELIGSLHRKSNPHSGRQDMADSPNKIEIGGTIKWEPRTFEAQEEGQKTIVVFAIEWERPKSGKKSVFNIKAFGDLADELKKEGVSQGDVVSIVGSLNETNWKDKKTDEWKKQIEVWANKVEFVERISGSKPDTSDFVPVGSATEADDDIPF